MYRTYKMSTRGGHILSPYDHLKNMEDLKDIVRELKKVRREEELNNLSDDVLFDCAIRIFNSQNIQRDRPKEIPSTSTHQILVLASDKQINMLIRLGYKGDTSNLSRREATGLIKELLERANQNKKPIIQGIREQHY